MGTLGLILLVSGAVNPVPDTDWSEDDEAAKQQAAICEQMEDQGQSEESDD